MTYARSLLATWFRVVASKLDGMETVQINHVAVQNDIYVYTTFDADPIDIAKQISFHMRLHE